MDTFVISATYLCVCQEAAAADDDDNEDYYLKLRVPPDILQVCPMPLQHAPPDIYIYIYVYAKS